MNEFYRQFPRTEEHAFRDESKNSIFNLMKIYEQIDYNEGSRHNAPFSVGNFGWVNGIKDSQVAFHPDPGGRFKVRWVPSVSLPNRQITTKGINDPVNEHNGALCCQC